MSVQRGRRLIRALGLLLAALVAVLLPQQTHPAQLQPAPAPPLETLMPRGAMVYLEARDLGRLVSRWNDSAEKAAWLQGANYEQFQNSKIYLKLSSRLEQFARSAGFEINAARLGLYAGKRAALALYNPSEVEFLFLTELTAAERQATDLIRQRGRFQPRQASGRTYFLNQEGGRTVAYAEAAPYFAIATREDLLQSQLELLANPASEAGSLGGEPVWRQAAQGRTVRDLSLFLDLDLLLENVNFRGEWLFDNLDALRRFRAASIDLEWTADEIREQRTFLWRETQDESDALPPAMLEQFVPNGVEFVSGQSRPEGTHVAAMIDAALLNPLPQEAQHLIRSQPLYGAYRNYEWTRPRSAYERRLDEADPPAEPTDPGGPPASPAQETLGSARFRAMVEFGTTRQAPQGPFLEFHRGFVLSGEPSAPGVPALQTMIEEVYRRSYSAGGIGFVWRSRTVAGITYSILSSKPFELAAASIDGFLVLAAPPFFMDRIIQTRQARLSERFQLAGSTGSLVFFGTVDLQAGRPAFDRFMNMLDHKEKVVRGDTGAPLFFSETLSGLLSAFDRLQGVRVERRSSPDRLLEIVRYRLGS